MMKPCFLNHVLTLLLSITRVCLAEIVQKNDQETLLAFKATITSDPYQILSKNWSTTASICTWIGVSCTTATTSPQRITALNVSGFGFQATHISPNLGNLTFLTSLDLSINNFTGFIPRELSNLQGLRILRLSYNLFGGEIPKEIGNLSSLEMLDLKYNFFTGFIPYGIFNFSNITSIDLTSNSLSGVLPNDMCNKIAQINGLYLSANLLSGQIPFDIYKCKELEGLSLSFNHFNGSIPRSIGWLTKLQRLYLGTNNFQGKIPTELQNLSRLQFLSIRSVSLTGQIPSFIFNMSSLVGLDFGNNSLSGSVPVSMYRNLPNLVQLFLESNRLTGNSLDKIWDCKQLQVVSLSNNNLTGYIPKNIGNLTTLKHLYLNDNNFTGELPSELGNLNLVEINVRNNGLSGPIPPSIFNISTIEMLELQDNHFSGHLPSTFGLSLPNLKGLYLGSNKLSGLIPSSISNATSLTIISMTMNSFSGPFPDLGNLKFLQRLIIEANNLTGQSPNKELSFLTSLTHCRYLEGIGLSQNQFDGFLPNTIGNFSSSLRVFRLFDCRIKGPIPAEIGKLINLQDLYLDQNELTGVIPRTLGNLRKMVRIYLEYNKLEGDIPSEICRLSNLGDFYVTNNALHGVIPSCIGELKSLRRLYLDANKLESNIPLSIYNLKDLLALNFSSNRLNGSLPSEIGNFKVAEYLDLSRNQFTGDVPSNIDKAQSLDFLSLAHNKFQGSIPNSLGNLAALESLDLSYNNFSGSIPKSLEELTNLKYFNVSYNRLEGEIPMGGNFSNFTPQSYLNNYGLCGAARLQVPPCGKNKTRSKNVLKYIIIPLCVVAAIFLVIMILLLMRRRKTSNTSTGRTEEVLLLQPWRGSSYIELQRATNGFSASNIIGSGGFGTVYIGTLSDGLTVAIKVFNLQSEKVTKSFEREIEVLRAIRHRNLIKIIGCCSNQDLKALVLEYMPNGSLEKWLYSHNLFLDLLQRLNVIVDVAFALEYLHTGDTFPIVHCDLKPSNVLLDENMTAHVGDFGVAKLFVEGELMAQTRTLATIGYMAPEYGAQGIVSTSGDIYSFGIMVLETFTRKKPTDEMFGDEMSLASYVSLALRENNIDKVVDINLLEGDDKSSSAKEECLSSILHLAVECLAISPSDRINIREVVAKIEKIRTTFLANTSSK